MSNSKEIQQLKETVTKISQHVDDILSNKVKLDPSPPKEVSPLEEAYNAINSQSFSQFFRKVPWETSPSNAYDVLKAPVDEPLELLQKVDGKIVGALDSFVEAGGTILEAPEFSPSMFVQMVDTMMKVGLPPSTLIISYKIWVDIIRQVAFTDWVEPVKRHELILEGMLGSLMGVTLFTDGFRDELRTVIKPGEAYLLSEPQHLGVVSSKDLISDNPNLLFPFHVKLLGTPSSVVKFKLTS